MRRMGYTILYISEGEIDELLFVDLQNNGFSLLEAHNETESIGATRENVPQIIILDFKTLEFGTNIIRALRSETELNFIPKIVVSAVSDVKAKVEMFDLGISDYITRPYDYEELLARLNCHLINSLYSIKLFKYSEKLKEEALIDEMTGLFNKKYLVNRLVGEVSRAARKGECLSLVLVETDNYDYIMNTYGESAKNYIIKQVSIIIKQLIRLSDILIRYDDRRLGIFCPITDRAGVDTFAERLLQMIHESIFEYNGEIIKFSIKLGVYTLESSDFNSLEKKVSNITEHAEEAVQRAANSIGDRIEFYE